MLRVPMIILAALYLAFSAFTAVAGTFAGGGTIPERILLSLVHPAAAILLLLAVSQLVRAQRQGLAVRRLQYRERITPNGLPSGARSA